MRVIGIARGAQYSPGIHEGNDRLILEATAAALRTKGCAVTIVAEADVPQTRLDADVVFTMAQGTAANAALEGVRAEGVPVVNDPAAVARCCRVRLLDEIGPDPLLPPTIAIDTAAPAPFPGLAGAQKVWVKRAGPHAMGPGDTVCVDSAAGYGRAIDAMRRRGIEKAVVQRHVEGQVVKVYGVVGSGFFRLAGDEQGAQQIAPAGLRDAIEAIARRIGLEIYGGDFVLAAEGVRLIDLNDWPSFAPCREEAAAAIAELIYRRGLEHDARRAEPARA